MTALTPARLRDGRGHGVQVLLSRAAADLLTRDVGEHRLKVFDEPQRVYELQTSTLPESFPLLRAASVQLTTLGPQLPSFIGRERELTGYVRFLSGIGL